MKFWKINFMFVDLFRFFHFFFFLARSFLLVSRDKSSKMKYSNMKALKMKFSFSQIFENKLFLSNIFENEVFEHEIFENKLFPHKSSKKIHVATYFSYVCLETFSSSSFFFHFPRSVGYSSSLAHLAASLSSLCSILFDIH